MLEKSRRSSKRPLTPDAGLIRYNIAESHLHLSEVGTWSTFTRKCGVCRDSIKTMSDLTYAPKGEDDASVRAWDDVGLDVTAVEIKA